MAGAPAHVLDEIKRHDVQTFKVIGVEHEAVTLAIAFLMQNAMESMALKLRHLAQNDRLRVGPLQGFVASSVVLAEGDHILLSDHYPDYNAVLEMMASLVHEIGTLDMFNRASEENERRCQLALAWAKQERSAVQPPPTSLITLAAQKKKM